MTASGLVGRGRELALALAFLAGLAMGPAALDIEGDAGIGKTALWRATVAEAPAHGCRVLTCAGAEAEARLSFVGLSDLIGDVVDEEIDSLPAPQREALERALTRRGDEGDRLPDPRTIGLGLLSLLIALAAAAPVLIAVDDVQWLDGATSHALAFVVRRLRGHRVGLLTAERSPLTAPDPLGLERAFSPDRFARIRLGPLDLGALRELLDTRLGHQYSRPVLHRIEQLSGGNPLFALEIARALGPAPSLEPGAPLAVPDSLRELAHARVASLPSDGREALLAAAALSRPTAKLVERATSGPGLAAAEEASLVRVERGRVEFAHPLYASAVYADAPSGRRRELHKRLAELVDDSEEQARHLALGAIPPDEEVAARLEAAALQARGRGAWDAGGELLELANAFTPPAQLESQRSRAVRAAEYHIHAGDRPRARSLVESVLVDAPRGPLRSEALRLLAEIHYNDETFLGARELLEEALIQAEDPALECTLELTLTYVYCHNLSDFAAADHHAEEALDRATTLGDGPLQAEALAVRAMVDFLVGRGVDWTKVERSLALEEKRRLLPVQMRPSTIAALLTLYVGRLSEARERLSALCCDARDSGDESDLSFLLFWLAWVETQSGAFAAAVERADESLAHAALTGAEANRHVALGHRALANAHRGAVDETRADATAVANACARLDFWQPMLFVGAALALLELSLGNAAAAWAATQRLTEAVEARGVGEPLLNHFLPTALDALIALGELDRAERLLDAFETRATELDRVWGLATGARSRALLLAARGDLDGADRAIDRALNEHARLEMPFELARTLLVQGQVKRRRREIRAARDSLDQALALFGDLGARLWADQTRAELDRLGGRQATGELTAAEQRVVELAVDGRSNKEIASALFVSVHTVELHLSHAYAKLGIRSRAQLGGRLGRP